MAGFKPFVSRKNGVSRIVRDTYSAKSSTGLKTEGWWSISKRVRERDHHQCVDCKALCKGTGDVHHVISLSRGGSTCLANLILLCAACHTRRHPHMNRSRRP